jgi:biotin carboxyl carrier protein
VPRSALEAAAAFAAREPSTDPLRGRFRVGLGRSPLPPAARAPDGTVHVLLDGRDHAVRPPAAPDAAALARAGGVATGAGAVEAPLPGRVVTVRVTAGDAVASGDVLLTLEAMKMEHPVNAPYDGVVTSVACDEGDLVAGGALLIEIEAR